MIVCICNNLSDREIRSACSGGDVSSCVHTMMGCTRKCGRCLDEISEIVEECKTLSKLASQATPSFQLTVSAR